MEGISLQDYLGGFQIKILTIGGTGMLGASLMLVETSHKMNGTYFGEKPQSKNMVELNIVDEDWVNKIIRKFNPDAIIHTAAITNVDICEQKPDYARKVHVHGTKNLVQIAKEMDIYFLYISTDSVFDGSKGNYSENDKPNPLNIYAKTKYDGENVVLNYSNSSIIRTNIYGYNWLPKNSIAEWILDTLMKNKTINLFRDVFFSPILVNNLTEALIEIVERNLTGIYHIACPEGVSKLNFGRKLAKIYELNEELINPISISELNLKAPRPLNPTLNCSKIQRKIKTKLLNVREGLYSFKNIGISGYLEKLKAL